MGKKRTRAGESSASASSSSGTLGASETTGSAEDYSSQQYWDQRYKDKAIEHEWYYSFDILEPILSDARVFQPEEDRILELGCGDRSLIQHFQKFAIPANHLYAIDYSQTVIEDLAKLDSHKDIHLQAMDARKMSFADGFFQFVVEKGTIDAMLSASRQREGLKNAQRLVAETVRVMSDDATFVIVSHIQVDSDEFELLMDEILMPALNGKAMANWNIDVHSVKSGDKTQNESRYGTVYVIRSKPRKRTRNAEKSSGDINVQFLEYSDSDGGDEEEGEGEGDEEAFYCMPCEK